ncbi:MAG: hypothetical protein IK151_02090 [Erysipelotrichaceae bacterium]|nr:hypothetical protein [Erysipelotrichaceae bacterium]
MKLELGRIFAEHMVLQQGADIPVWGRSANNDEITVRLGDVEEKTVAENGVWSLTLPKMDYCSKTTFTVTSKITDEKICFEDVAIGEVWLAGGQSNMEFIMKYDVDCSETVKSEDDPDLRFFNFPQTPFLGFLEKESCPDHGFWRRWVGSDNKIMFSAIGAYMGMILREKLNVPIGIVGCNWGGTPASAWTDMEDLKNNEKLKEVLDEYERNCAQIDFRKYYETSELPVPLPTKEQLEFTERFMMGEDMTEFFKNLGNMPKPDPSIWATYPIAPRSATRPAGVYETMLKKVAPYAIKGVIWYQGEDDDARGWYDFYDESMKTMIICWRRLWGYEFPFFQIELATFEGVGITAAKAYNLMRHKQEEAAKALNKVYDVCILDAGEKFNIHPRHKEMVGERLAYMVLKHVYNDNSRTADCPRFASIDKSDDQITITFSDTAAGLEIRNDLKEVLCVSNENNRLEYEYSLDKDRLVLKGDFKGSIKIEYCEMNYCLPSLFNSEGNPVFGFTAEVRDEKQRSD